MVGGDQAITSLTAPAQAYPVDRWGTVLPFRRLFVVAQRDPGAERLKVSAGDVLAPRGAGARPVERKVLRAGCDWLYPARTQGRLAR